jgi:hypothetical protein
MPILNLAQARERLRGNDRRRLSAQTFMVAREDGGCYVEYDGLEIITFFSDGRVEINAHRNLSPSMRSKFNSFSPFRVDQRESVWYVRLAHTTWGAPDRPIFNGIGPMTLHAGGVIEGGMGRHESYTLQARRRSLFRYASSLTQRLRYSHHNNPPPGNETCAMCALVVDEAGTTLGEFAKDTRHIENHMRVSEYVPALIARAAIVEGSTEVLDALRTAWTPREERRVRNIFYPAYYSDTWNSLQKAVRRYLCRQYGLVQ